MSKEKTDTKYKSYVRTAASPYLDVCLGMVNQRAVEGWTLVQIMKIEEIQMTGYCAIMFKETEKEKQE